MVNKLPKKLTISFPILGLYDIDGKGFYADTDKMMRSTLRGASTVFVWTTERVLCTILTEIHVEP